jgi:hypothetical protein
MDDQSTAVAYAFVVNGEIDPTYDWWWNTTYHTWGDCMVYPPMYSATYTIQVIARDVAGDVSQPSNPVSVTAWA